MTQEQKIIRAKLGLLELVKQLAKAASWRYRRSAGASRC